MIRFSATVDGAQVLDRTFNRIDNVVSDLRSVWPFAAAEFYAIEHEQFESEGAHGASGRWAPLSAAYARFKAVEFPGQPILRATTALYESMTSPDANDSVYILEADQMTIGTRAPYALAHHRGNRRLPARPVVSLNENDRRRIQKAIQRGLVQFTREAGFQVLQEDRAA